MNTKREHSDIAVITGNEDDGFNVQLLMDEHAIEMACESKEDAEDLRGLLNRCSWFSVHRV
ncbi:MAG TPA: hypothetical protein VN612_10500 [Acidobacteriaceae bacterium]|nr:hypothetical protein [Acidobacteriaceae bacterium]